MIAGPVANRRGMPTTGTVTIQILSAIDSGFCETRKLKPPPASEPSIGRARSCRKSTSYTDEISASILSCSAVTEGLLAHHAGIRDATAHITVYFTTTSMAVSLRPGAAGGNEDVLFIRCRSIRR